MKNETITYRPIGRVVARRIGEDHLLVPVSGVAAGENVIFPANESGIFIWDHLSIGESVSATAQAMAEAFEVDVETALDDCQTYANRLVEQKLLEIIEA